MGHGPALGSKIYQIQVSKDTLVWDMDQYYATRYTRYKLGLIAGGGTWTRNRQQKIPSTGEQG